MACCWHQAIAWTNIDFSFVRFCDIHMRAAQAPMLYNGFTNYASPTGRWVKGNIDQQISTINSHIIYALKPFLQVVTACIYSHANLQ